MLSLLLVLSQSAQTVSIDAKCDEPTLLGNVLDEIKQTFSQCWLFLTAPGFTRPLHATHSLIMATQSHYETLRLAPPASPYLLVLKFSRFLSPHIHSDSSILLSFFFPIFFLLHSQLCGHSASLLFYRLAVYMHRLLCCVPWFLLVFSSSSLLWIASCPLLSQALSLRPPALLAVHSLTVV